MREFERLKDLWVQFPGVRALILEPAGGPRVILKPGEGNDTDRYSIVGVIE